MQCLSIGALALCLCVCTGQDYESENFNNGNGTKKDMYVIHAMVYQIGILTNVTDNGEIDNNNYTGAQEALTFYHTNGSDNDLSQIPQPLQTNVTGQDFVGVASHVPALENENLIAWSINRPPVLNSDFFNDTDDESIRTPRDTVESDEYQETSSDEDYYSSDSKHKSHEDINLLQHWFVSKRNSVDHEGKNNFIKVFTGNAVIPQEASIQSIGLPSLLSLTNNLSKIPVPIPNTSLVHYAKVIP